MGGNRDQTPPAPCNGLCRRVSRVSECTADANAQGLFLRHRPSKQTEHPAAVSPGYMVFRVSVFIPQGIPSRECRHLFSTESMLLQLGRCFGRTNVSGWL